jgi:hypothetical protein
MGGGEFGSGSSHPGHRVHLVRAVSNVRRRARLGRSWAHCLCHVVCSVDRVLTEWQAPTPPVAMLPINTVTPRAVADGPAPELEAEMKSLYEARYRP